MTGVIGQTRVAVRVLLLDPASRVLLFEARDQVEHFFAARSSDAEVGADGWTELEQRAVTSARWWSSAELRSSSIRYFPENLPDLLSQAASLV